MIRGPGIVVPQTFRAFSYKPGRNPPGILRELLFDHRFSIFLIISFCKFHTFHLALLGRLPSSQQIRDNFQIPFCHLIVLIFTVEPENFIQGFLIACLRCLQISFMEIRFAKSGQR